MLFFFRSSSKREPTSRTYDITGSGFSALPLKSINEVPDSQTFQWNIGLVKDFAAIFSSTFLASLAYGILMVLIAFRLEANIKSEILISLSTVTQIGAGVIFSRFLPMMGRRTGMINSLRIGSIISAVGSLMLYFYFGYLAWLICIFFIGTSFFICGVTRNTVAIDLAPNQIRAGVISFATMLVAIGNSLGPVLLSISQTHDHFPSFLLASFLFVASTLPLKRLEKIDANVREEKSIGLWRYIKNSPKIMFAAFTVGYAMSASSSFVIIYGIKIGISDNESSLLLSTLLFGTIFYIPLGYLANILNRRFMMIVSATFALVMSYLLCINQSHQSIHLLLFLLFGVLAGIKLPAIVLINEKYKPTQRLAVNSAFSKFSLIGNICGLFLAGFFMERFGPEGLWFSISLILSVFLIFCVFNYAKKIFKSEFNAKQFSIFNQHQNEQLPDN